MDDKSGDPMTVDEEQRLEGVRAAMCAFVPREERFDRITRMAQRLLQVPIALITVVEDDVQWFRSAQGWALSETPRHMALCDRAIANEPLQVMQLLDARRDRRFAGNPLVLGPPYLRAYAAWPLELGPGLRVGTLCVLDTMPRSFSEEDIQILADLGEMAETEIRLEYLEHHPKVVLANSNREQRRRLLDPITGCWSESGLQTLLRAALPDVATGKSHAALCALQIHNISDIPVADGQPEAQAHGRDLLIVQFLRQRLPTSAILCRLSGHRACALLIAPSENSLREQMEAFMHRAVGQPADEVVLVEPLEVDAAVLVLTAENAHETPDSLLQRLLAQLADEADSFRAILG